MKPNKSILDKSFAYRNSSNTDVAATFKRIRREMAKVKTNANVNVTPLKRVQK